MQGVSQAYGQDQKPPFFIGQCWNPWLEYSNSFLNSSSSQVVQNSRKKHYFLTTVGSLFKTVAADRRNRTKRRMFSIIPKNFHATFRNETNSFRTLENTFHPPERWWTKAGLDVPEPPTCLGLLVTVPLVQGGWQYCWKGDGKKAGKSQKPKSIREKTDKKNLNGALINIFRTRIYLLT